MIDQIINLGYENVELSGKSTIIVKVLDSDRISILKNIAEAIDGIHDTNTKSSSIGCIIKDKYKIFVKPLQKQGDGSAGKPNENLLFNKMIEFKGDNRDIIVENVKEIFNCSRKRIPKTRLKTDIEIHTDDSKFNISLKQDNAEIWESADSYCADLVHKYVNHLESSGIIVLECNEHFCKLKPEIGIECNDSESHDVVFGDDIYGQGAVIKRTFTDNDFEYSDGILTVKVSSIIQELSDLSESQKPFFHIRNDKTRNCGIQGLRVLAVYQKRINANVHKINLNERL